MVGLTCARRGRPRAYDRPVNSAVTGTELRGRSLVSMRKYTGAEIMLLLDAAAELKTAKQRREFGDHLAKRNIACVFTKPSSRTRSAFVVAAADEGAHLETFTSEDVRLGIKESVKDLARTLGRVFDGIAYRGDDDEALRTLADHAGVPVWNALSDQYHPTQALADLMTVREVFGTVEGTALTYVGDGRNNVARSLAIAAIKTGLDLRILAPRSFRWRSPRSTSSSSESGDGAGSVLLTDDARAGTRRQRRRLQRRLAVDVGQGRHAGAVELLRDYKVTEDLMAQDRSRRHGLTCTACRRCTTSRLSLRVRRRRSWRLTTPSSRAPPAASSSRPRTACTRSRL